MIVSAVELRRAFKRRNGGKGIGHLGFGNEVSPADLNAIDAEILGHQVDQAFTDEIALEAPRTPIGPGRGLVCGQVIGGQVNVSDGIGPGHELGHIPRGDGAVGPEIGAVVGPGLASEAENPPIGSRGDLDIAFGLPRMICGAEVLAAILDPLDRAAQVACREGDEEVFRIELAARAKATADINLDHLDLLFPEAQGCGKDPAVGEGDLGRTPHGHFFRRRVPARNEAPRFHEKRRMTLHPEGFAADVVGGAERGIGVPACRCPADGPV